MSLRWDDYNRSKKYRRKPDFVNLNGRKENLIKLRYMRCRCTDFPLYHGIVHIRKAKKRFPRKEQHLKINYTKFTLYFS